MLRPLLHFRNKRRLLRIASRDSAKTSPRAVFDGALDRRAHVKGCYSAGARRGSSASLGSTGARLPLTFSRSHWKTT